MINIDSFLKKFVLPLVVGLVASCASSEPTPFGLSKDTLMEGKFDLEANPLVVAFQQICLAGLELPSEISDIALANGWRFAEDQQLEQAELASLKKLVLEIPGGGGRFNEEQILFSRSALSSFDILNLERRYTPQHTLSTQCDVYGPYEFLKSCEALGKLLGKAPDHNQAYKQNGAHFIRWDVIINSKNAVVSCDKAPNSATLPYTGISLSVKTDQTTPPVPRSTRPVSAVSGR